MVDIAAGDFNGMDCLWLSNGQVRLAVTTDRGPRIVSWGLQDGPNLLAELPDAVLSSPNGPFNLLGGHRLWYAPEVIESTYWPDTQPVTVVRTHNGASFTQQPDGIGIVKTITLELSPDSPQVTVAHTLLNTGSEPRDLAPWALSMCRLGGVALLPQPQAPVDSHGLWPNRRFSFWPYTDVTDKRIALRNRISLIFVTPGPNNKVGYHNTHGWFAYQIDGILFSKHFNPGLSVEFYFSDTSIELESLGNLVTLAPGKQAHHGEVWRLYSAPTPVQTEDDALALASALNL
jgi:hypothetical protein